MSSRPVLPCRCRRVYLQSKAPPLLLNIAVLLISVSAAHQKHCHQAHVIPHKLTEACYQPFGLPALKGLLCESLILHKVCVIQEQFVLFDFASADGHPNGDGLPNMSLSLLKYHHIHARPHSIYDKVHGRAGSRRQRAEHRRQSAGGEPHVFRHGEVVKGREMLLPDVRFRYASAHEILAGAGAESEDEARESAEGGAAAEFFDDCITPLVVYSSHAENYGETFGRVPVVLHMLTQAGAIDGNVSVVQYIPDKLPLQPWAHWMLQPYSASPPTTLAELSQLHHPAHPACFATIVLLKINSAWFPKMVSAAADIMRYNAPALPPSPWRSVQAGSGAPAADPAATPAAIPEGAAPATIPSEVPSAAAAAAPRTVTKVLIEVRGTDGVSRQWVGGLDAVLRDCAQRPDLECIAHTFGDHLKDLAVLREADVLVAYHGGGEQNALFMPPQSSLLEVHPADFGTTFLVWPAYWMPRIAAQADWHVFYFGLNVEDRSLNLNSPLETQGIETNPSFNARDRSVALKWDYLGPMLDLIIAQNRSKAAYQALAGDALAHVSYTWVNGKLEHAPPVHCSNTCGAELNADCRPCSVPRWGVA